MRQYVNSQSVPETGSNRPFTSFNPRLGDLCTRRQATGITLLGSGMLVRVPRFNPVLIYRYSKSMCFWDGIGRICFFLA